MQRHKLTSKHTTTEAALLESRLFRGLCTRVAKRLGVTTSVVCRVAKGTSKSRRITEALVDEWSRIKKAIRKQERAA
jgi:hypothetical protein